MVEERKGHKSATNLQNKRSTNVSRVGEGASADVQDVRRIHSGVSVQQSAEITDTRVSSRVCFFFGNFTHPTSRKRELPVDRVRVSDLLSLLKSCIRGVK